MKMDRKEAIETCILHLNAVARIASDYEISVPFLLEKVGILLQASLKDEVLK